MDTKKTTVLWQFLLKTKFKLCALLPRTIMAVYEEDELYCYRSTKSKFCLNATYRCLCFELYFWNSSKLLASCPAGLMPSLASCPSGLMPLLFKHHHVVYRLVQHAFSCLSWPCRYSALGIVTPRS